MLPTARLNTFECEFSSWGRRKWETDGRRYEENSVQSYLRVTHFCRGTQQPRRLVPTGRRTSNCARWLGKHLWDSRSSPFSSTPWGGPLSNPSNLYARLYAAFRPTLFPKGISENRDHIEKLRRRQRASRLSGGSRFSTESFVITLRRERRRVPSKYIVKRIKIVAATYI